MPSLEVFVVFHKNLYAENYSELSPEEFECLTFVAVNPAIEKSYPAGYKVLNEWELPIYDPVLQQTKWNENSVLFHLHQNNRITTDFVGVAQYDMKFKRNSISSILHSTLSVKEGLGVLLATPRFAFVDSAAQHELQVIHEIPRHWTNPRPAEIVPLLNTFVVHRSVFDAVIEYMLRLKSLLQLPPNANPGGVFERVSGYALSQLVYKWYRWNVDDMNQTQKHHNY